MQAMKIGWSRQIYASASSNESFRKKAPVRKSKDERRAMVETFILKYKSTNNGCYPSLNFTQKEVGGSFYTIRDIMRDVKQENRASSILPEVHLFNNFEEECSLESSPEGKSHTIALSSGTVDENIEVRDSTDPSDGYLVYKENSAPLLEAAKVPDQEVDQYAHYLVFSPEEKSCCMALSSTTTDATSQDFFGLNKENSLTPNGSRIHEVKQNDFQDSSLSHSGFDAPLEATNHVASDCLEDTSGIEKINGSNSTVETMRKEASACQEELTADEIVNRSWIRKAKDVSAERNHVVQGVLKAHFAESLVPAGKLNQDYRKYSTSAGSQYLLPYSHTDYSDSMWLGHDDKINTGVEDSVLDSPYRTDYEELMEMVVNIQGTAISIQSSEKHLAETSSRLTLQPSNVNDKENQNVGNGNASLPKVIQEDDLIEEKNMECKEPYSNVAGQWDEVTNTSSTTTTSLLNSSAGIHQEKNVIVQHNGPISIKLPSKQAECDSSGHFLSSEGASEESITRLVNVSQIISRSLIGSSHELISHPESDIKELTSFQAISPPDCTQSFSKSDKDCFNGRSKLDYDHAQLDTESVSTAIHSDVSHEKSVPKVVGQSVGSSPSEALPERNSFDNIASVNFISRDCEDKSQESLRVSVKRVLTGEASGKSKTNPILVVLKVLKAFIVAFIKFLTE